MSPSTFYALLADLVLVVHFAFVAYVVLGLIFIWVGFFMRCSGARNFWFRLTHLAAIGVVVAESVFGVVCPLTVWENELRLRAGGGVRYETSFVAHWIHEIMFFDLAPATFTVIYGVFFALVVASLVVVRPRWPFRRESAE